ncbi:MULTISPECIES: hypothetical protein [unclassified Streptomyces]|nr:MULTISPECIES: hypothetical protein [unclassified Streptomyces]
MPSFGHPSIVGCTPAKWLVMRADVRSGWVPCGAGTQAEEDTDGDRLPDDLEVRAKLNPKSEDTDGDGLSDFAELGYRSSTPLKADTDGDGVQDGEETRLNASPRAKNSAFDVTRRADGGATAAEATLKGLRAKQVGGFQVTGLPAGQREFPESTPGHLGNGFQVSAPADGAARLTFRLDADRAEGAAPALYRYDEKTRHLVKQSGRQRSGNTITVTATAGSAKYVILDSHTFDKADPKVPGKRTLSDAPGDGGDPSDPGDPPPTDMLIHQSSFREGRRKAPDPQHPPVPADPRVADDLTRNFLFQEFLRQDVKYPVYDFSLWDADQRALSIAIHQFHGHTIALKDYKIEGNSFSGPASSSSTPTTTSVSTRTTRSRSTASSTGSRSSTMTGSTGSTPRRSRRRTSRSPSAARSDLAVDLMTHRRSPGRVLAVTLLVTPLLVTAGYLAWRIAVLVGLETHFGRASTNGASTGCSRSATVARTSSPGPTPGCGS